MKPRCYSHRQDGAALIVVLILMVMAAMLATTGLQGGVTNEKLAGNYRADALAKMAAETVASSRITRLDESAGEQACREIMDDDPRLSAWTQATLSGGSEENHQRAYYTACRLEGEPGYAIAGEAVDAEGGVLARHRVIVAGTGGGPDFDPPSELSDFSILTGGALVIHGQDNVEGEKRSDYGVSNTPVPELEYIDAVRRYMGNGADYLQGCAARGSYVFCDSQKGFDGDLTVTDSDSEKTFVVDGAATIKLKTKQDIRASFVSSGSMVFNGASKTRLGGLVWVGGALMMNGTGNFAMNGSVVVGGSATFNGGLDLTGADQTDMLTGDNGITWQEF
ncbi:pilus assembly PilX family protein [Modicisalibacter tunisiensis]|uniref:Type 4 fimbrial biogenesis protein PilX N-terminal domain-containing protein n=1 Tax=Modicisalibacter tunisiensis TaxID=390637 RepID=A0ABS7WXI3_9GAMM|nr:PilX N-terminal domain-containing pilus assembly protein [Modicisalibacter tunisiensis]MBZ9566586.1 hypothetical protein [Modicisalibacter tunisiensis]